MQKTTLLFYICWLVSTTSTLGSLFFSEIMQFPPCVLCWYQRIAMYPLVILFFVGTYQEPRVSLSFTWPLVLIGWIIALYHNLLHYGIVPESASPCMEGVSCSTVYISLLGFITIPMMSFIAFTILGTLLLKIKSELKYEK